MRHHVPNVRFGAFRATLGHRDRCVPCPVCPPAVITAPLGKSATQIFLRARAVRVCHTRCVARDTRCVTHRDSLRPLHHRIASRIAVTRASTASAATSTQSNDHRRHVLRLIVASLASPGCTERHASRSVARQGPLRGPRRPLGHFFAASRALAAENLPWPWLASAASDSEATDVRCGDFSATFSHVSSHFPEKCGQTLAYMGGLGGLCPPPRGRGGVGAVLAA